MRVLRTVLDDLDPNATASGAVSLVLTLGARPKTHLVTSRRQHGTRSGGATNRRALRGAAAATEKRTNRRANTCADTDLGRVLTLGRLRLVRDLRGCDSDSARCRNEAS